MNIKTLVIIGLVAVFTTPLSANPNKKNRPERGMLERMEAVTCGAKQKGFTGLGSIWASVGITRVNSNEKLCPQYLLRTDEMEYEIRPTDGKHPAILEVGHEAEFKMKKNRMLLSVPEGSDRKKRTYEVVAMRPTNSDSDVQNSSTKSPAGR